MASDVDIANLSLVHVGGDTITSLTDENETARIVNTVFIPTRNNLLSDHPWTFATKETTLALSATVIPLIEWTNAFQMPSDYLGFPVAELQTTTFEIVGNFLYTDEESFKLKYLANISDPVQFDESFIEAFALKLAWVIGYAISKKSTIKKAMQDAFIASINKARHNNAIQSTPKRTRESSWILSRSESK